MPSLPQPFAEQAGIETAGELALELAGVSKSFPGVRALDRVDLEVRRGEVHGLVGENGAGKSTLMAIASGALAPDAGGVGICGTTLDGASPLQARQLGLAIVHQRPALLPDLTVAENFAMGLEAGTPVDEAAALAVRCLRPWGALGAFSPGALVGELSHARRFVLEIARALAGDPRVLILDEPTEHLDRDGAAILFDAIARLRDGGCSVVYISHRIREVKQLADRITVLRDGVGRGTFPGDEVSEERLVELIAGRTLEAVFPPKRPIEPDAPCALALDGFAAEGVEPVTLELRRGEIVGLAGIEGNGQRELMRALAGHGAGSGTVSVDGGPPMRVRSPQGALAARIAYLTGDRHQEGLLTGLSVRENMSIASLARVATAGVVRGRAEQRRAREQAGALAVKAPSLAAAVDTLSGGNQQKVMLARMLLTEPRVLLADEPTQGVDVGTRAEIYQLLRRMAEGGTAVLVLSSDALELEGLCDRVLVFSRGAIVGDLVGAHVREPAIAASAVTATGHRAAKAERPRRGDGIWRLLRSSWGPPAVLLLLMALFGAYTASRSGAFASSRNLSSLLVLVAALAFVAYGQQIVMLTGGIDLSVGPLAGFLVVIASFYWLDGVAPAYYALGALLVLGAAAAVGLANWLLVDRAKVQPMIATLVTYMALQGLSLALRPTPGGEFGSSVVTTIGTSVGPVPLAFVVALLLGVALELGLRRTRVGIGLRAIGSDLGAARQLGARDGRLRCVAYVACSACVVLGALVLMAQNGVGDANAGTSYTLASVAAVVLGGASIFGGRGSFVGALAGAALIELASNATVFLNLDQAWQQYLVGGLTLIAATLYSYARRRVRPHDGRR